MNTTSTGNTGDTANTGNTGDATDIASGPPVLVLGGTGKTGRRVAERLGGRARVASRSGAVHFDWDQPTTWGRALAGAEAVYLVPPTGRPNPSQADVFLAQVAAAGVRRVTVLSARGADFAGEPALEKAVREADVPWTILRPSWFAQNFSEDLFLAPILAGEVALPTGKGREAFVDADDIADVAVATLTDDGHAGRIYELSGPEPLSFGTAVARIAEATGRSITYRSVSAAEFPTTRSAHGLPAGLAPVLALLLAGIADGWGDHVSDGVRTVLGRPPRPFAAYVRATAATGVWDAPGRG